MKRQLRNDVNLKAKVEAAGAVIMWQLLGALHYLQRQLLSHGDVCPANVRHSDGF